MSDLSNRLKAAIKASGLSQRELEGKTGIPHSAIQRYAAGTTDRIPISRIVVLAKALDTTAEDLLGWTNSATDRAEQFVELFAQLTDEQQNLIISQIKGILSNQ